MTTLRSPVKDFPPGIPLLPVYVRFPEQIF